MRRKALKQKKIWNPALFGIRNPLSWNPESSTRNPESTAWNPESKTAMERCSRNETLQEIIAFKDKVYIQIQKALWSKLNNLKPFFSSKKSFTFQQGKQHFGLRSESRALPTDSLFHKAWWTKSQGRRSIGRLSPTSTKASFVSTNDRWSCWSVNKNSKVELKIYRDVQFETSWRGDWRNAAGEYRMQNWHLIHM